MKYMQILIMKLFDFSYAYTKTYEKMHMDKCTWINAHGGV